MLSLDSLSPAGYVLSTVSQAGIRVVRITERLRPGYRPTMAAASARARLHGEGLRAMPQRRFPLL